MSITIVTRAGKGSPLNATEHDANLTNLAAAIDPEHNADGTHKAAAITSGGGILHSLATAANDFLVASGAGAFAKQTLAQVKTLLGLVLTQTALSVGFTFAGGTTSKTLTVEGDSVVDQDLTTDAKPTFAQVAESQDRDFCMLPSAFSDTSGLFLGWNPSGNRTINMNGINSSWAASLKLPSGVTITDIELTIYLNGGTGQVTLELLQYPYNSTAPTVIATTTTAAGASGGIVLVDINHKIVTAKNYVVQITSTAINQVFYIYPCRIIYIATTE
jgi:hypothetical protein